MISVSSPQGLQGNQGKEAVLKLTHLIFCFWDCMSKIMRAVLIKTLNLKTCLIFKRSTGIIRNTKGQIGKFSNSYLKPNRQICSVNKGYLAQTPT